MQQSFIAARSAGLNSWVSESIDQGTNYLKLKQINDELVVQNKSLLRQLYGIKKIDTAKQHTIDESLKKQQIFTFIDGEIVTGSINRKDNYFTINRGKDQGIRPEMGVISPNGIAGIVINTTENYALVKSILSVHEVRINAALKNSNYYGTLTWKGEDSRTMHLADVPKYVALKVGDTVITDGKSSIFPQGITIGTIAGYDVDPKTGFWDINVELSEHMGQLKKIFVVKSLEKTQRKQIQDSLIKAQNGN